MAKEATSDAGPEVERPVMSGARPPSRRKYLVLCAGFLLIFPLGGFFLSDESPGTDAARTGFPLDDAWIHMVYSRSLAETGLPCYNNGEAENGFTSPLWMIVGILPHWAERCGGPDAVMGVKVIGLFFGWLAACAMALLLTRSGCRFPAAILGGLLVAVAPPFVFAALSGMEVTLTAFLMIAALVAFRSGSFLRAGIACALALLARPEAVLLLAFLAALFLWENRAQIAQRWAHLAKLFFPGLAAVAAWAAYSLAVTGRPLPNTFYMKFESGGMAGLGALTLPFTEAWNHLGPMMLVPFAILVAIGIFRDRRRGGGKAIALASFLFGLLFLVAIYATREMPEGCFRYYYWWRYLLPAVPFLLVPASIGFDALATAKGGRAARGAGFAAALVLVGCAVWAIGGRAGAVIEQYAWNCRNINEVQVDLGRWIDRNLPQGATIAVNDAGALRYFGNRRTIDLVGLNRHEAIGELERGEAFPMLDLPGKLRWLHDRGVHHLAVFPCWFPDVDRAARAGVPVAASGGPLLTGQFVRLTERKSETYTITEAPPPGMIGQNVKAVYSVRVF